MVANVRFIYASTSTGVMGQEREMPWYVPEDLQLFKEKTLFGNCLMGRNTYDSLPPSIKPLPNRKSYIATRNDAYGQLPETVVVKDPVAFVKRFSGDLWVIGGAQLFKALESYCNEVHHTLVHLNVFGDTIYKREYIGWEKVSDSGRLKSRTGIDYEVRVFKRPFGLKG